MFATVLLDRDGPPDDAVLHELLEKKRNLGFVCVHAGGFDVGFALRERKVVRALASALSEPLKQALREARPYLEGRGVRVQVQEERDLEDVRLLLALKRVR